MRDVIEDVDAWVARGDRVALATVIDVKRSAPRPPGAKMAINDRGEVSGAVSGGCVEGAVVEVAEDVLRGGEPQLLHFGIADSDAWDVGLPCGGEIDVYVERYQHTLRENGHPARSAPHSLQSEFADLARGGGRGALVTVLRGVGAGGKVLVRADGTQSGSLGSPDLDDAALRHAEELMWDERSEAREEGESLLFVDVTFPAPRLIIFGIVAWPEEAFARLGGIDRATSIVVPTHDPKLDDAALTVALRSDAAFVGAMGSRRAQAKRRERLLELGMTDADLEQLSAPVGLDLGAMSSEETALSILSEVVSVRHGREGGRLSRAAGGRIHEVGA